MAFFPMFVNLNGADCLVIGAGEVALRKIEQLVKFSPQLSIVAPQIHPQIHDLAQIFPLKLVEREYIPEDIDHRFLVIGALDDLYEQACIYNLCMDRKIPVNCVDSPQLCSFIFPALIIEEDLCIGINTSGRAPAVSSALRRYLSAHLPSGIGELIDKIDHIRQTELISQERQTKIIRICCEFFKRHS